MVLLLLVLLILISIENNLQSRLLDNDGENKIILKNILVLEKSTWPEDPDIYVKDFH